jgi:hypothetical protein
MINNTNTNTTDTATTTTDTTTTTTTTTDTVVVTRHAALVELLVERGIIPVGAPVLAHAGPADVEGKHVIGVLPFKLAALAASVTEVPLALGPEDRGVELSLERLREIAGESVTYKVTRL